MASFLLLICVFLNVSIIVLAKANVYGFSVTDIDGQTVSMEKYKDKLLLIVNVASQCGYTDSNYKSLEAMYSKYKDVGFEIAAFPCNQVWKLLYFSHLLCLCSVIVWKTRTMERE